MAGRRASFSLKSFARSAKPFLLPAVIGALGASASFAYSFSRLAERSRPDLALAVMPWSSTAKANKADALLADLSAGRPRLATARKLAQQSLDSDALNPVALRTIAATEPAGSQRIKPILGAALKTSRREVGVHLMLIELAVAEDRVGQALGHYDQALRVRPSLGSTLFPVLLAASTDRVLNPAIRGLIASDPPWLATLAGWVIENPDRMAQFALLVPALPLRSEAASQDFGHEIVETLVDQRHFAAAYATYLKYRQAMMLGPREDRRPYRPFEWMPLESPDFGAEASDENVAFEVYASKNTKGDVLRRLVRLAPGAYRLGFGLEALEGPPGTISVSATCPRPDGSSPQLPARSSNTPRLSVTAFTVPAGCEFQWLQLSVKSGLSPFRTRVSRLTLSRAG